MELIGTMTVGAVFSVSMGGGSVAPTITGDHQNRITDYTAIVVEKRDALIREIQQS